MHWRAQAASRANWKQAAWGMAVGVRRLAEGLPWTAVRITATYRYRKGNRRDWDNLMAQLKPLLDGIVAAGVMTDDSTAVIIELQHAYECPAKRDEVELRVERWDG